MKHRRILDELERILRTIPDLRVERDSRQPEDEDELREFGPVAILYSGERETAPLDNADTLTWSRRWELKPVITVIIHDAEQKAQRERLEDIEDAFITALDNSDLLQADALLARGTSPELQTRVRHPDEAPLGGIEMFLNLTYLR